MDFDREGLGVEVDFQLPAEPVIRSLNSIIEWRGKLTVIRVDNGPEYISGTLPVGNALHRLSGSEWNGLERGGFQSGATQTGKPRQNAYIERCNRTVTHDWLDQHVIETIEPFGDCTQSPKGQRDAQDFATQWLWTYTNDRPNVPFMA